MSRNDNTKDIIYKIIRYIYNNIYKNPKMYLEKLKITYNNEQYNKFYNFFNNLNINFIGELHKLPEDIQKMLNEMKKNIITNKYNLHFALAYDYYNDIKNYGNENNINYNRKQSNIDLILRTGGEYRTSGFFPTKSIYSELFILKKLWPEITYNDFVNTLIKYNKRSRRFGK